MSSGIATMSPNAVVFIATEILADSKSAFSAGFAFATAVNAIEKDYEVEDITRMIGAGVFGPIFFIVISWVILHLAF